MVKVVVYCGWSRETEIICELELLGSGAARIKCLECGGTGDWTPYHPDTYLPPLSIPCIVCKGTGFQLVSV